MAQTSRRAGMAAHTLKEHEVTGRKATITQTLEVLGDSREAAAYIANHGASTVWAGVVADAHVCPDGCPDIRGGATLPATAPGDLSAVCLDTGAQSLWTVIGTFYPIPGALRAVRTIEFGERQAAPDPAHRPDPLRPRGVHCDGQRRPLPRLGRRMATGTASGTSRFRRPMRRSCGSSGAGKTCSARRSSSARCRGSDSFLTTFLRPRPQDPAHTGHRPVSEAAP